MSASVFEEVMTLSGLSDVFAREALCRACQRAGLVPAQLSADRLEEVLPHIARTLRVFLPKDEVARRLREIQTLCSR